MRHKAQDAADDQLRDVEEQAQDSFGTGLRAYLGRHAAEDAGEPLPPQAEEPVPPLPAAPPTPDDFARRAQELADRERRFAEHVKGFEQHVAVLQRREQELRQREEAAAAEATRASTERRNVREALREHAEGSLVRIFEVFDDALRAEQPGGGADHGVRLAAVRALLAEAYAKDGDLRSAAAVVDELADMRHRRTATT